MRIDCMLSILWLDGHSGHVICERRSLSVVQFVVSACLITEAFKHAIE